MPLILSCFAGCRCRAVSKWRQNKWCWNLGRNTRGVVQEEETDDINVFYDKTPEPTLALELKFFNSSRICEEGQWNEESKQPAILTLNIDWLFEETKICLLHFFCCILCCIWCIILIASDVYFCFLFLLVSFTLLCEWIQYVPFEQPYIWQSGKTEILVKARKFELFVIRAILLDPLRFELDHVYDR